MTSNIGREVVLIVVLFSLGQSGWLPIDSITNRNNKTDVTCNNNARSVVADPRGNIHIVWRGQAPDTLQVWYSFWDAQTREWSQDTVISSDRNKVGDPAVACDSSGSLYVAWITAGILRLKRRDGLTGEWLPQDSLIGHINDSAVSIAIDRNGVQHLAWARLVSGDNRIYYVSHSESGWGRIDTVAEMSQLLYYTRASIACTPEGNLMIVWHERGDPFFVVKSRCRVGNIWGEIQTVYNQRDGRWPSVCWAADSFNVVWVAFASGSHQSIMYRARGAGGWGDTLKLCPDRWSKTGPCIAADPTGNLFATWAGFDSLSPDYAQIYYSYRLRGGQWMRRDTLTSGQGNRLRVSMSVGLGKLQVAWTEKRLLTDSFAVRLRRYERIHDIGVLRIEEPGDTVDSAMTVRPVAWVRNFGDFDADSIFLSFRIGDSFRFLQVNNLAVGDSIRVVFDSCFVNGRSNIPIVCSVYVAQDVNPQNDVVRRNLFVRVRDVVLESISPKGRVDDSVITPCIRIYNSGNVIASFPATCSIFSVSRQVLVHSCTLPLRLGPRVRIDTAFPFWIAQPDSYLVRMRLKLAGDMHPENDTASGEFWVVNRDAGILGIIWPVDTVDFGTVGTPRAVVKNFGDEAESIAVRFRIGGIYDDTFGLRLASGGVETVGFKPWQAVIRGNHSVSCSTMLTGDRNQGNNRADDSVFVRVLDAGVVGITKPAEMNSRGEIAPEAKVKNYGNCFISLPVYFWILDSNGIEVHSDSVLISRLSPQSDSLIRFSPWLAQKGGSFTARCSTALNNDMQPENDTITKRFRVARWDVAARKIISPSGTVVEGVMEPVAQFANLSEEVVRFYGYCSIFSLPDTVVRYFDSVLINLDTGEIKDISFHQWQAMPGGHLIVFQTNLSGDENQANDTISAVFYVESLSNRCWQELLSIPRGTRNRPVRAGGCLVSTGTGVYALKGSGCAEFFRYEPGIRIWSELAPMPSGQSGHKPKAGAAMSWDKENRIYALKGRNTREFWLYNIASDSWISLAGLPEYTKGVRFGSGLVFVGHQDTGKIFCLKGSGTNDFLVYWVKPGEWHARRPVPKGFQDKPVKRGSALVGLGNRIFCLKGGTNEFYEYLPDKDSWRCCSGLSLGGERWFKKCREGAALTSDGHQYIYAFKGGRTNEFWRYDAVLDSWEQMENIPPGNRRRRVGPGGALAFFDGRVYALKGGGCREFWCYEPNENETDGNLYPVISGWEGQRSGVDGKGQAQVSAFKRVIIYDVSGRIQREDRLKPGVYFKLEEKRAPGSKAIKVIVFKRG